MHSSVLGHLSQLSLSDLQTVELPADFLVHLQTLALQCTGDQVALHFWPSMCQTHRLSGAEGARARRDGLPLAVLACWAAQATQWQRRSLSSVERAASWSWPGKQCRLQCWCVSTCCLLATLKVHVEHSSAVCGALFRVAKVAFCSDDHESSACSSHGTAAVPCKGCKHGLNHWTYQAERVLHGNPSGIDNSIAIYGGEWAHSVDSVRPHRAVGRGVGFRAGGRHHARGAHARYSHGAD